MDLDANSPMHDLDALIALAHRLADAAGAAIRPHFATALEVESKHDDSPVTVADRAAERAIRDLLAAERPGDGVIGEEYGRDNDGAARVWVLDPIDGTKAFITGRPIFGTLIALLQDGVPVLGVIDQPVLGQRWIGAAGRPTLFNGAEVSTRRCAELSDARLTTTSPDKFSADGARAWASLRDACDFVTYGGDCYAYGLIASGFIDVMFEEDLALYDFAALGPVIEGAGGMVTDWTGARLVDGSDGRVLACGDRRVHAAALERLSAI